MGQLRVASYCTTFLKSELLQTYRQVSSLRRSRTFVMTKKVEHRRRCHFDDIERIPRPHRNLVRHGWMKFVECKPPLIYRGEYKMLVSILGRRGADMMHIYFGHTGVHLLPFVREWNRPCLVSFHGADVAIKQEVANYVGKLRLLFDSVALVLARSQSLADRLIKFGCPREKIRINRTGIPLHEFSMVPREFPTDGRWQIMQACRLIEKKGVGSAIRAFAIFAREFPKAEFIIAGKGPLQPELQGLAQKLGVAEKVHFCGFLSQPDLRDLYGRTHIFLHPSETPPDENQEGVPNSILEARATGLPVAATQHGGIPEAVEHGRTGWLVPEEDPVALAKAMHEIARSPRVLTEMGLRAREAVIKRFGQEAQIDQLEWFYEEAIVLNGAAEPAESKAITSLAPQFAEQVPAK